MPRIVTLGEAVAEAARTNPDGVGWIFENERITFAKMDACVDQAAAALFAHGIRAGDRIAVWLPNKVYWPYLLWACARLGALTVALNTRWKATEAAYVLRHSKPKFLFAQASFLKIDFAQLLSDVGKELGPDAEYDLVEVDGDSLPSAARWDDFWAAAQSADNWEPDVAPVASDPVLLQYTSGTTSRPKGALVPHVQILNCGVEYLIRLGVQPGETFLNTQPLYHVGGSCAALPVPLTLHCTVVIPEYYDALKVLTLIDRERPVARTGTDTMYLDEMKHPRFGEFDTSSLRTGWVGAPRAIFDQIRAGYPLEGLINLYAATEGGAACGRYDEPVEIRRMTVGKPLAGCELKIADVDEGRTLPAGTVGEICYRGWNRMIGYFNDPERTAETIDEEGFVHSGDLGVMDEDGYLYFRGRIKEMIKPGGENVAAEEVEEFLLQHRGIARVAVIAAPDLRMREVVMAIVERKDESLSEDDVVAYCTGEMANFRIPKHVRFTTEWPITSTGKIARQELRRTFVDEVDEFRAIRVQLEGEQATA